MRNDAMDITGRANTDKMPLTQAERLELAEERKKEAALKWVSYDCKIHGQYTFREDRNPRCRKCVETSRFSKLTKQEMDNKSAPPAVVKVFPYHEVEVNAVEIGVRKIHDVIRIDKILTKGDEKKCLSLASEWFNRQYPLARVMTDISIKIMG